MDALKRELSQNYEVENEIRKPSVDMYKRIFQHLQDLTKTISFKQLRGEETMRIILCFVAVMALASLAYGQEICKTRKGKPWVSISVKPKGKKLLVDLIPREFSRNAPIRVSKRKEDLIIFRFVEPKVDLPSIPVRYMSDGVAHEDALNCGVRK